MQKRIENFCDFLDHKFGAFFAAVILSFILLFIGSLYVTPYFHTVELGEFFQSLSVNPFNLQEINTMRFRILTPLLAHLLFLRGRLYILMPLAFAILFLSSVYIHFRKSQHYSPAESMSIASLLAFSMPVLFTFRFPGYVDIPNYLFVFLCFVFSERKNPLCFLFFSLGLLNHESIIFMLPAFMLTYNRRFVFKNFAISIILLAVSFIPVVLYRHYVYVYSNTPIEYSPHYYVNPDNIKHVINAIYRMLPLGIFMTFKLFWVLPVLSVIKDWKNNNYFNAFIIIFIIFLNFSQLLVASDTSRTLSLGFLAIILGARQIKKYYSSEIYLKILMALIGLNFLVPQYYIGQEGVRPFFMVPISILFQFFGLNWHTF